MQALGFCAPRPDIGESMVAKWVRCGGGGGQVVLSSSPHPLSTVSAGLLSIQSAFLPMPFTG